MAQEIMTETQLSEKLRVYGFDSSTINAIQEALSFLTEHVEDCDLIADFMLGQKERMLKEEDLEMDRLKEEGAIKYCLGIR